MEVASSSEELMPAHVSFLLQYLGWELLPVWSPCMKIGADEQESKEASKQAREPYRDMVSPPMKISFVTPRNTRAFPQKSHVYA